MAILGPMQWEVEPGVGNANNGGGWDGTSGTPGTDYSQSATPVRTWLAAGGTYTNDLAATNAASSVLTSASYNFAAADVGNIINITAGTKFVVGRYQIISVATNAATLDRNATDTTGNASAGTGYEGGACAALSDLAASGTTITPGNTIWIKGTAAAADGTTTSMTIPDGSITLPIQIKGYNASHGDLQALSYANAHDAYGFLDVTNYPVLNNANLALIFGSFNLISNINFSNNKNGDCLNFAQNKPCCRLWRCKAYNANTGASTRTLAQGGTGSGVLIIDCDLSVAGNSGSVGVSLGGKGAFIGNRVTATTGPALTLGNTQMIVLNNVFYDITGANTAAIQQVVANAESIVIGNTFNNVVNAFTNVSSAQTGPHAILIDNQCTNSTNFFNNLYSGTSAIPVFAFNNRTRNLSGSAYVGVTTGYAAVGDTTSAQADAAEYVDLANKDFRLHYAAAANGLGLVPFSTPGAFQRQETLPTESQVKDSVGFGTNGTEFTGNVTLPTEAQVKDTVQFGASGTEFTGNVTLPTEAQVKDTIQFGASGTEFTGNVTLPTESQVKNTVQFGASGTEFTGNVTLPATTDVKDGVTYGASGTEFEGELVTGSAETSNTFVG